MPVPKKLSRPPPLSVSTTKENKMPDTEHNLLVPIHPRIAAGIALEGGPIDIALLVAGAQEIIQANIAAEEASQLKRAHQAALLLGAHIRTTPKISAWKEYQNETH
jgi:hypothetical protein